MVARHQVSGTFQRKKTPKEPGAFVIWPANPLVTSMASLVLHQPKRLFQPEAPALVPQVVGKNGHPKTHWFLTISKTLQKLHVFGGNLHCKTRFTHQSSRIFAKKWFCQRADLNSHIPSRNRELLPGVATGIQIYRTSASELELLEAFADRLGKIRAFFLEWRVILGAANKTGVLTLVEQIILWFLWSKEQGFWGSPQIESLWSLGCLDVSS